MKIQGKIRAVNFELICPVQLKDDLFLMRLSSWSDLYDPSSPMPISRSKSFSGIPNPSSLDTRVEIHSDDSDYEQCEADQSPEDDEHVTALVRRRSPSIIDLSSYSPGSHHSYTHAASETYMITRLTFKLLKYLGIGYRWICKFIALSLYALFLLPGFVQIGWYYFFSKSVHRSIVYGDQPRNRLDLYLPAKSERRKPAVAFVTGGAWIIGYKAWGALFGRQLVQNDIIVACIDYRNFPQGSITDMVDDVSTALAFLCKNIDMYGGNIDRLYLAGQSAGAHIAACTLVEQARKEVFEGMEGLEWSPSNFKAFFGISGGYNLLELVDHFHKRGLYRSLFLSIMEGEGLLPRFSPELVLRSRDYQYVSPRLPPMVLFHGTADYSIPCSSSDNFASALQDAGVNVTTRFYEGKTHTDIILQDPMRGGKDQLIVDMLEIIHDGEDEMDIAAAPFHRRMVPECLLQLARKVSPF